MITIITEIWCNACQARAGGIISSSPEVKRELSYVAKCGWIRKEWNRGTIDLCPKCKGIDLNKYTDSDTPLICQILDEEENNKQEV